jgi:hypothetical protein
MVPLKISTGIGGKFDRDRQEDIVFQIGQSKAIRNAIVRAMPAWLVDQAIETAQGAELKQIKPENIHKARANVMQFFSTYAVTLECIEAKVGRAVDEWTAQDIVDLRGNATALKEGRVAPEVLFPPVEKGDEKQGTPQGARGSGGNQPVTESQPDPEPPPAPPDKKAETKTAGQTLKQPGKNTAKEAQDLLESMQASYSTMDGIQPPRVRTFRHNDQAYTCTSSVSSGKAGIIHLDAWRLIPERSYKGTQWDYPGLLKLWDAGQRERGDMRGMQVLLGDNLMVLADALRFYPDRDPQRIKFNKPGDPDFNPSPQTSSRSFKNPTDLNDLEFERMFGQAVEYLEEFAKKSNSGMSANDIFLQFRKMLLETPDDRREELCLMAEENPADCLYAIVKYKSARNKSQQAHTEGSDQDGPLFKSQTVHSGPENMGDMTGKIPKSGQQVMDELVEEGKLGGNKSTDTHAEAEIDITPAYRSNWINLRQGDIYKGTGLEAYIMDNLEAFKAGWTQLDSEVQEELGKKFQQFYNKPLPFLQDSGSEAPPKKDNHAVRYLALQYQRDWAQLWKDGAKNKGIDYKLRVAEMTTEQCRIMVNEVEELIDMQRRFGDDEQF